MKIVRAFDGVLLGNDIGELLQIVQGILLLGKLVSVEFLHPIPQSQRGDGNSFLSDIRFEVRLHLTRALVSSGSVFGERFGDDGIETRGVTWFDLPGGWVFAIADETKGF